MSKSRFYDQISHAREEREVDAVYTQGLNTYFKGVEISHPFKCDSYLDTHTEKGENLRLLVEYKFDENFANQTGIAKVLTQVIFYLKQFELSGMPLPNVVLVGDINECFVLQTNVLQHYLDTPDIDWGYAPSNAWQKYPMLMATLANDTTIAPFVYRIDENFSFQTVANRIIDQADNVKRFVRVTEHNIANIYEYYCSRVIKDAKKVMPNDLVAIFMGTILDTDNYYQHPKKPQLLVTPDRNIDIEPKAFHAFFSVFDREYTLDEKRKFAEISDRLIEETKRRRSGEFYTPTPFVDYAHQMLTEQLGENWRDEYVVWDCCWGTGNLTRDYRFKELYASTLESAELQIGEHYNREATKFVFDFLNDSIEGDLTGKVGVPQGLRDALQQDKPILFLINPPYGTASSGGANTDFKEGCAETMVHRDMMCAKVGGCSQNLYAQFLYRILIIKQQFKLSKIAIGLYSPTLYLSGPSWKGFRNLFLKDFDFQDAFTFKASYFADVADSWGIAFSVWKNGETMKKDAFLHQLINYQDNRLVLVGKKWVYNTDDVIPCSSWVLSKEKSPKNIEMITAKSSLNISDKTKKVGLNLGYLVNDTNNIDGCAQGVYFMTMPVSRHLATVEIQKDNFLKATALFAARRTVSKCWENWADEFIAPQVQNPLWREFVADAIVYSLFESKSNQSSLRRVEYKDKVWDIRNEFFYHSRSEIEELANQQNYYDMYEDVHTDKDRFVYKLLALLEGSKTDEEFVSSLPEETLNSLPSYLSAEAKAVLDKAREITRKTFPMRTLFNDEHPEYQILNWDCGWYQIKALAKEYATPDLDEFSALYKALADKMRPMVYELGFLK